MEASVFKFRKYKYILNNLFNLKQLTASLFYNVIICILWKYGSKLDV